MKFKFTDPDLSDFVSFFMVEGATQLKEKTKMDLDVIWPDMFDQKSEKKWELKVLLNDVELPAEKVFEHIDSQLQEMIEKKAVELIADKFQHFEDVIDDFKNMILTRIRGEFPDYKNYWLEGGDI